MFSGLPPELVRKGRLDEIFFIDLPGPEVRREVFWIYQAKRGLEPDRFDLASLAQASAGFTGAGIEQAMVNALCTADSDLAEGGEWRGIPPFPPAIGVGRVVSRYIPVTHRFSVAMHAPRTRSLRYASSP
jgi:SpoVK/Ycf46/Vps4 family AAA+-type ATPase